MIATIIVSIVSIQSEQKVHLIKSHKCVCKNDGYCHVKTPEAHNKLLKLLRIKSL